MRNVKKFLALVLAMLMVVSAAATVSAFEDVADDHAFAAAINDLTVKEIVNGYDGETFGPDDAVTRQQMALMMARAITGNVGDDAVWAQGGLVGFEDVTEYQYAIATVVKAGIVDGFLDNTFRPEEGITFVQALKMAVAALGYDDGNLEWWQGYYNVALDLGLTENLNYITDADKALNRGEVAQLIYNMLYIELADGSDCFASQNFGLATATNLTTFIITATDEQTAYEGMDVAEGGYVGIQTLVNGLAEGDVIYLPVEAFGFEDDEDEAAFLSAYNLVNWNEDEGTFDQIIPTGDSWKIGHAEISKGTGKFAYDGKNYYPVEALTGTAIKNEVVLYNSTDFDYDEGNKVLFLNKNGQVLDPEDGEPVLEAVYAVNGDIVSYRVLKNATAPDKSAVTKGQYLSVSVATAKYGAVVDEIAQSYTIVDENQLTGAYELTVFDDDMDGKMDRAYWTPVHISVYEAYDSDKIHDTDSPFKGHDEDATTPNIVIEGLDDLAEGDVFVYTYNKQLHEVTVLDVLEIEEGAVKKINTTTNKSSTWYSTITLTDGTELKLYNYADGGYSKAEVALGAEIWVSDAIEYDDADGWLHQVAADLELDLVDDDKLLSVLEVGDLIRYYSRNGVILFAETYDIDDIYERVILKDVIDADLEAIYLDVYRNGEVEEIAVTSIWDGDEYVTLADLSWIKVSKILGDLVKEDTLDNGNIYKIAELADGYQMSVAMDDHEDDNFAEEDDDPSAFGLFAMDLADLDEVVIEDGIVPSSCIDVRENRLRTNDDTIWYFIDEATGKVRVATGEIDNAEIVVGQTTRIYADKLGYKNLVSDDEETTLSNKGVATVVYVINAGEGTYGFGWGSEDTSVVFMNGMTSKKTDYYTQGDAEEVGLNTKEYTASNYYKYASTYSIDMYSGSSYTVYSTFLLENNTPYTVDENGVVISDEAPEKVAYTTIVRDGIDYENDYIEIVDIDDNKILNAAAAVETIKARITSSTTTRTGYSAIKSNILTSETTEYEIAYIEGFGEDGIDEDEDSVFVFIVGAVDPEEDSEADTLPNAYYQYNNKTHMGVIEDVAATTAKISATLKFSADQSDDIDYSEKISLEELLTLNPALVDDMIVYIGTDKAVTSIFNGSVEADGYDFTCEIEDNEIIFEATAGQMKGSPDVKKFTLAKDTLYRVAIEVQVGEASQWAIGYFKLAADVK